MTAPTAPSFAASVPARHVEGSWHSPGYRSGSTRARWAQGLFVVVAVASALEALAAFWSMSLMGDALLGNVTNAQYVSFVDNANGIDTLYAYSAIALAVAVLAWLSRTVEIVPALGAGTPRDSPRWAIGWWFVPIANLWKPYTVVREVWERLATATRRADPKLVLAWWITWLVSVVLTRFAAAAVNSATTTLESAQGLFGVMLVAEIGSLAAAVLGFLIVREIQARADERAAGLGFDAPLPNGAALSPSNPAPAASQPGATAPMAASAPAVAFCASCGTQRPPGGLFCATCGARFSAAAGSASMEQPQA